MGWILAIVVGGIAGWLASLVMNRDASMGIFWNVAVGVVGAVVGKFVLRLLHLAGDGNWFVWFVSALIGAIILLAVANLIQRGRVR